MLCDRETVDEMEHARTEHSEETQEDSVTYEVRGRLRGLWEFFFEDTDPASVREEDVLPSDR